MTNDQHATQSPIVSYEVASEYVRGFSIKSRKEYRRLHRSAAFKDPSLPLEPQLAYKTRWISWRDYLGDSYAGKYDRKVRCLSYEDAKKVVQSLRVKNPRHYEYLKKLKKLPAGLPSFPQQTYVKRLHSSAWAGWRDFLGEGYEEEKVRKTQNHLHILPYELAQAVVRRMDVRSPADYRQLIMDGKLPHGLPKNPGASYSSSLHRSSWRGWKDFLGTPFKKSPLLTGILSYNEAKKIAARLKLDSHIEYKELAVLGKLPKGLPKRPRETYSSSRYKSAWKGWKDYLGTENSTDSSTENLSSIYAPTPVDIHDSPTTRVQLVPSKKARALSYDEAKAKLAKLGEVCKTKLDFLHLASECRLPRGVPKNPKAVYSSSAHCGAWKGWDDFLQNHEKREAFKEKKRLAVRLMAKDKAEKRLAFELAKDAAALLARTKKLEKAEEAARKRKIKKEAAALKKARVVPRPPSFSEACAFAKCHGIKDRHSYRALADSGLLEELSGGRHRLPLNPHQCYKASGWTCWADFLS